MHLQGHNLHGAAWVHREAVPSVAVETVFCSEGCVTSLRSVSCLHQLLFCMQIDAMKQQPQLVVATPGRLLDLIDDDECPLTLGRQSAQVLNVVPSK